MRISIWLSIAAIITGIVCALVAAGYIPLGVPGQWEWGRLEVPTAAVDWLCVALVSLAYVVFVSLGSRWIKAGTWARCLLMGLVCSGVVTQASMQQLGFGLGKWPFVLYS